VYVDQDGHSGTIVGGIGGFLWGAGQMAIGMGRDIYDGQYRSGWEYMGIWGQNFVGGVELGASVDVALLSGGVGVAMGSGALGGAGLSALTLTGRGDSRNDFLFNQAAGAAVGGLSAGILSELSPIIGAELPKLPYGKQAIAYAGKGARWVAGKASVLGDAVMSNLTRKSAERFAVQQVQKQAASITAESLIASEEGIAAAAYADRTVAEMMRMAGQRALPPGPRPAGLLAAPPERLALPPGPQPALLTGNTTGTKMLSAGNNISTPYGIAPQEQSAAAIQKRVQIQQGLGVYKGGVLGKSETDLSQFLATEYPLNPGYASRYGIPPKNINFDFVLSGKVRTGAPIITRSAPGIPPNPGGGVEGVINPGDLQIEWFHMP
jgi:hypothetical protein